MGNDKKDKGKGTPHKVIQLAYVFAFADAKAANPALSQEAFNEQLLARALAGAGEQKEGKD